MTSRYVQLDLMTWNDVPHPATVFESEKETALRDSICKEWRECTHGATCMNDEINVDCVYYKDEPYKLPESAKPQIDFKTLINTGYSRDEAKVLAAGYMLVRYTREEKLIEVSAAIATDGWKEFEPFLTYAAAERKLKEMIDSGRINTGHDGKIIMTGWNRPGGLINDGFEFYRCYGMNAYDQGCCIKQGSKNWSNWGKYADQAELITAWDGLMNDDLKALEG